MLFLVNQALDWNLHDKCSFEQNFIWRIEMTKSIDEIQSFWDANPLLSGELEEPVGTERWFKSFDEIKTREVFAGDPSQWIQGIISGVRVLDIGCGPGYWNRLFGQMKVEYHGIDISPNTVKIAKKAQELFGVSGDITVGNAEKLGFPDVYFDYIVSEGVIHHTPDTQACINEIYRVLKPNGYACVGVYYRNIILRSRFLFKIVVLLMRIFHVSLKGRGRDRMHIASNADEFVRMYDGADNPIGKAYTKGELKSMFCNFSQISLSRYYFPVRAFRLQLPQRIQKFLNSVFGLMVLVKVKK